MSDTPVILSWNITNWITVVLMVTLGMALIKIVHTAAKKHSEKKS